MGRRRSVWGWLGTAAAVVAVVSMAVGSSHPMPAPHAARITASDGRSAAVSVAEPRTIVGVVTLALLVALATALVGERWWLVQSAGPSSASSDGRRARWWARLVGAPPLAG